MIIQENIPLAPYTTFRIGGHALYFCILKSVDDAIEAVSFAKEKGLPYLVVGAGSNLIVPDSGYRGLVMKCEIKGREFIDSADAAEKVAGIVRATIGAGEDWEGFVAESVERGLYGIESLSLIPGTVGAAPVQNVGAYGTEASSVIVSVNALDTVTMKPTVISNVDCKFAYRDSVFKREKGRYIVTSVMFKLSKTGKPNIEYKDVREYFAKRGVVAPSLSQVREAVIDIRRNKLPDWKQWGTAGSYFKNPIVPMEKYEELRKRYPDMPAYVENDGRMKLSLGWILDKLCEAKGLRMGKAATFDKQALVIVADKDATAGDVATLADELVRRVKEKTGLDIEREVEWVGM